MRNNKIKSLIITVIFCVILYLVYTTARDYWIYTENQNYEIHEYEITEDDIKNIKPQ